MRSGFQWRSWTLAWLVLWVLPCAAQLGGIGDNVHMKANGTVSAGYAGSYGSESTSGHSLNLGGSSTIDGSYYDPNFISFSALPYYNQSRDNSSFQSVLDSSGISATFNIIKASHFPGSLSYAKSYNSTGNFGAALPNFTTHGNSTGMGVSWGAMFPGLPTLTATFASGNGGATIFGTSAKSNASTRTFSLRSMYLIRGFSLNGNYSHNTSQSTTPDLLSGQQRQEIDSSSSADVYSLGGSHALPMRGALSVYVNRINFSDASQGITNASNATQSQHASAQLRPLRRLSLSFSQEYTDNLAGALNQSIVSVGGLVLTPGGSASHSLNYSGGASLSLTNSLGVSAMASHVDQFYAGQEYKATYFNGTLNGGYGRKLFGLINWSVSLLDNASQAGNTSVGMLSSLSFSRSFTRRWNVSEDASYARNVQTLLAMYTNSYYRYSSRASYAFSQRTHLSASYSGSHSNYSSQGSSASNSQNISSTMTSRWLSGTGTYSISNGTSILTSTGLQASPVPTALFPASQLIVYGGTSYGVSLSANPVQRFTVSWAYSKVRSNTVENSFNSANKSDVMNAIVQYRLRKLSIRGGYSTFSQGISAISSKPSQLSTYYIGVYRWFNFF